LIEIRAFMESMPDYLELVSQKNQVLVIGEGNRPEKAIVVISRKILDSLLENVTFCSKVYYDITTNQYLAEVVGFSGGGAGCTAKEAIEKVLDYIEACVEHFFESVAAYSHDPDYQEKLRKYLKLKLANSREQLAEILGFPTFATEEEVQVALRTINEKRSDAIKILAES
jgi:hypothetical protein